MNRLIIRHRTSYSYHQPVTLGPHRLMLRPRESYDLRLASFDLAILPEARIGWAHDVFGNAVATATFAAPTDRLVIESVAELRPHAMAWPVFDIAPSALSYPFLYDDGEWTDLGALAVPQFPDPGERLRDWARSFIAGSPTDTLSLLKDLNAGIPAIVRYRPRYDEGTQPPLATLERRCGSCRDFAVLFTEAARSLGFGARIISGYLHNPEDSMSGQSGNGSTHAWAEIYVPGAGWITFDPTNRGVGGFNLVPVAVARDIGQVMPIIGSYAGPPEAFEKMSVTVTVNPAIGAT